jgi:hypothetical protein
LKDGSCKRSYAPDFEPVIYPAQAQAGFMVRRGSALFFGNDLSLNFISSHNFFWGRQRDQFGEFSSFDEIALRVSYMF